MAELPHWQRRAIQVAAAAVTIFVVAYATAWALVLIFHTNAPWVAGVAGATGAVSVIIPRRWLRRKGMAD